MDMRERIKSLSSILSFALLAILVLSFLMFTFVFVINWEDWFFGTKLAGPLAGAFLSGKAAVAFILIFLLVQYPRQRFAWTFAAIAYFGILFVSSSVTIRYNTGGGTPFSVFYAVLLAIPALLLISTLLAGKPEAEPVPELRDRVETPVQIATEGVMISKVHPLILLLIAMIGLMIVYILVIPFVTAIVVAYVPILHDMAIPKAHDTVLVKVDAEGNREWITRISGYSLDVIQLTHEDDGSCILYGTYWMPQQNEAQIRVLHLDRSGTVIWDMLRSRQFGTGPEGTAQIAWVDPSGTGAVVWLTNGGSIQIDERGNIITETPQADTLPPRTSEFRMPASYSTSELPAQSATVRIWSDEERDIRFTFEDAISKKEITGIYSVISTADGGFLVSGSVIP